MYSYRTIEKLCAELPASNERQEEVQEGAILLLNAKDYINMIVMAWPKLPKAYEDVYPLSQIQQGMVFYSKLKPEEPLYHDQVLYMIGFPEFNSELFCQTFQFLINKHAILRTYFLVDYYPTPLQKY